MNNTPPVDGQTTVVTGSTLSDAYKNVRREFGSEAVISGSRTRSRRKSNGWGTEQVVEVMVQSGDQVSRRPKPSSNDLTGEIRCEVERLEMMVEEIFRTNLTDTGDGARAGTNPVASYLVENGASRESVDRMLTRFAGETGNVRNDRPGAIAWLTRYLATGKTELGDWTGNHVFLGEHSEDRLGLVLHLAGKLTEAGRSVLVISVLPDPDRDEPRLNRLARSAGHDAAVVRDVDQLQDMESHLSGYDHVLLDLPGLTDHRLGEGGAVHEWLASNEKFHRHLLMPMDRDFMDLDDLRHAARSWNCDWLALTRLEGTRRAAKILDLVDRIPLPISFLSDQAMGEGILAAATPELLLDRILATESPAD